MDLQTARLLNELNRRFYAEHHDSFSQSRFAPWPGWETTIKLAGLPSSVLDVACGNMRFRRFLETKSGPDAFAYHGVDSCAELIPEEFKADYQDLDIVECLLGGDSLESCLSAPRCQMVVAFGFMHHIPTMLARQKLIECLVEKALPGGFIAVSFWDFASDAKLAVKAKRTTALAQDCMGIVLEQGDYLLGWQSDAAAVRYCHSFTDEEIAELVKPFEDRVEVLARFRADGRTHMLNHYLVARRRSVPVAKRHAWC